MVGRARSEKAPKSGRFRTAISGHSRTFDAGRHPIAQMHARS